MQGRQVLKADTSVSPLPSLALCSIVEGLAVAIARGMVPPLLRSAFVVALDVGALVAGCGATGDVEARVGELVQALERFSSRAILFIDEVRVL